MVRSIHENEPPTPPGYLHTLQEILKQYEVIAQQTDDELATITEGMGGMGGLGGIGAMGGMGGTAGIAGISGMGMGGLSTHNDAHEATTAYFNQVALELQETKKDIYEMLGSEEMKMIKEAINAIYGGPVGNSAEDSDDDAEDSDDSDESVDSDFDDDDDDVDDQPEQSTPLNFSK